MVPFARPRLCFPVRIGVGALVREGTPVLKVVQEESEPNKHTSAAVGGSLLDELVRDGARQMLAAALRAKVTAYTAAHRDEVDEQGRRLVVRNGYHTKREVATAAGAVPVRQPRVNDKRVDEATGERMRFSSAILPAWARKSPGMQRCCRCCTCTACPAVTSCRRWSSSSAPPRVCRPRRSPGSPHSGKTTPRHSASGGCWPTATTCTCEPSLAARRRGLGGRTISHVIVV